MELYHVGPRMDKGSLIKPFQFTQLMSNIGPVEDLIPWLSIAVDRSSLWDAMFYVCNMTKITGIAQEIVFEVMRRRYFPKASSRFESSFYTGSLRDAERFRDDYRPGMAIHKCKVLKGTAIERDMALVTEGFEQQRAHEIMNCLHHRAVDYWEASKTKKRPEVLVCGDVEVVDVIG